jgi:hypothetical protein
MKESNMPRADFIMSVLFIVFGIMILVTSIQMPRLREQEVNPYSVPGIVPGFLGGIIAFLGGVLLIRSIIRKGYLLNLNKRTVKNFFLDPSSKRLAITALISIIYAIVLLGRINYEVATGLYIFFFILLFEWEFKRKIKEQWKTIVFALLIAALTGAAVGSVFRYVFLVNLPG